MKRKWVVFYYEDKELLRYTLLGEGENEREETIKMLAWENDIPENEIEYAII